MSLWEGEETSIARQGRRGRRRHKEVAGIMFLKRLTVCGFKSFCDRVDFDFGPGVTCIVGPNGCGKSNVVDAVKWVLGEQSAKSLRGRQMLDMIFNGSSTRKSSSVAQVDLVFDNADRKLALDLDEVTVSRKLYRSGESEYLLNKGSSRLKDVRELFMDTGVGVGAYSVIEQGRVDQLLQSSPVDRRIIFEEAAGISKYKARRLEAERRLERTNQNLLRVADLIDELEKRLRAVRTAATKARNFKEYEARLNELRSSFAMSEFHRFTVAMNEASREVDTRTDRLTALKTELDRHESEETQTTVRMDALGEEIQGADGVLTRARSDHAAQQERIAASIRRAEEQRAQVARSAERLSTDTRRLQESRAEFDEVQTSVHALQQETHGLHARTAQLQERDNELARELTEAQATLDDEKAGIIELLRRSAQTHNEIVRLQAHRDSLVGQKGRLSQRDEEIRAELQGVLEQRGQFDNRLRELDELIAAESQRLEEKRAEATRVQSVRQRLVDEIARAKEQRSAILSRKELLEDLQRRMEGVGAGARQALERARPEGADERDANVVGLVADLFEVDVAHAGVIEAALAEAEKFLVVESTPAFFERQPEWGALAGRLTLVGLDRIPPTIAGRDWSGEPGFVARAMDWVRVAEPFEHLARHLLGRTIVVADKQAALSLAAADVGGHRFVTLDAEVIESDGRVSVGPLTATAGLISRKSELRDLLRQLQDTDARIVTLADQLNRTQAEAGHLDTVQQELRNAIYESNTARVEAMAGRKGVAATLERLTREQPLIAHEVALVEQQLSEVHEKSDAGGRTLESLEKENRAREAEAAKHHARIDDIVARRREVHEQLTQLKVAAGQLTEKRAAAADRVNALRRNIRELEGVVDAATLDLAQGDARIVEAEAAAATGREQLSRLATEIVGYEDACARLRSRRDELRMALDTLSQAARAARTEMGEVESERHKWEMSLAEVKVRREELSARIREELSIDLGERYAAYKPDEQDWTQVESEIAELRQKMERLGNVNLDAINELDEIEERHRFMAAQRDDLTESGRQLSQLIERLNEESKARFLATFEAVREHFRALFRKLFGGGRADIVLEDPEQALDCGIEIVAQPPGKELQVISLMSGGEKSMTAIALLMSIFKCRPAPFAILDEVDAALDELNNERFSRIVQEFVSESQFLIITHSKRTMAIGDHLYGVTMQEPGISTRVSVQLKDAKVA